MRKHIGFFIFLQAQGGTLERPIYRKVNLEEANNSQLVVTTVIMEQIKTGMSSAHVHLPTYESRAALIPAGLLCWFPQELL